MISRFTIYPLLLASCTLFLFTQSIAAFCYDYQGLILSSRPDIVPCNGVQGTVSMCCKTNTTSSPDTCLPNGLCRESGNTPNYWRNDCSDPNWPSGNCIKACTGNSSALDIFGNIRMTPCDGTPTSGSWCCGTSTSCCGTSDAIALAATLGFQITSSSPTTSTSPTSSPSPTTSASPTTSSAASTSSATGTASSLSGGAKAGIGIGTAAGALLVLCGVVLLWRRQGKKAGTNRNGAPVHGLHPALPAYSDHPAGTYASGGDRWKFWQKLGQGNDSYGNGNRYTGESQMVQRQELDAVPRTQELQ